MGPKHSSSWCIVKPSPCPGRDGQGLRRLESSKRSHLPGKALFGYCSQRMQLRCLRPNRPSSITAHGISTAVAMDSILVEPKVACNRTIDNLLSVAFVSGCIETSKCFPANSQVVQTAALEPSITGQPPAVITICGDHAPVHQIS